MPDDKDVTSSEHPDNRWRIGIVMAFVLVAAFLIAGKLVVIQVVDHDTYAAQAQEERWLRESLPSQRGRLLDRNENPLAISVGYETLYADPYQLGDRGRVATALSDVLEEPVEKLMSLLSPLDGPPMVVSRVVDYVKAQRVRDLGLQGVYLLPNPQRAYPEGNIAAQTLGLVGQENKGLSGIEAYLNDELAGTPGWLVAEKDTSGQAIALTMREYQPPIAGTDFILNIDRAIQSIAESELRAGVAESGAKGGSIVVMDPKTGAVLALANYPAFGFDDADLFEDWKASLYRSAAVADAYEPGSVFKILTMAAGIDSGAVGPNDAYMNEGSFRYGGGVVRNPILRPQGMETMSQVIERSSNIGSAYIATRTGADGFYKYVKAFGLGSLTGIEIVGESAGILRTNKDPQWNDFDLATNSFGQGISVTPVQMAAATSAIANGGNLMRPQLVKARISSNNRVEYPPVVVRQVIKPSTAKDVTKMMVAAVETTEGGYVRESYLKGYTLAGKTGTAEIPTQYGYRSDATITSYVGFGPAENPRFTIVVKILEPASSEWAEHVAAPIFRETARQVLAYMGVPPNGD